MSGEFLGEAAEPTPITNFEIGQGLEQAPATADPEALDGDVLNPVAYLDRRRALQQQFEDGDVQAQEEAANSLMDLEAQNPTVTAAHLENLKQKADLY